MNEKDLYGDLYGDSYGDDYALYETKKNPESDLYAAITRGDVASIVASLYPKTPKPVSK